MMWLELTTPHTCHPGLVEYCVHIYSVRFETLAVDDAAGVDHPLRMPPKSRHVGLETLDTGDVACIDHPPRTPPRSCRA